MTFTYKNKNMYCGILDSLGMEGIVDATPKELEYAIMRATCNTHRGAEAFVLKNINKEEFDEIQKMIDKKSWHKLSGYISSRAGFVRLAVDDNLRTSIALIKKQLSKRRKK